ncbi:MAG: hypothetical protein KC549_03395, partial [Myxococcales bacterium]|nr:hypothetical protein [Myxococcales bacterium]
SLAGVEAGRVAERAGELAAAQEALDAALARRAPLVDADARGRGEVRLAVEDARRFYNHLQIELLAAFPHERALAASFFG